MDLRKWHVFATSGLDEAVYPNIKFAVVFGTDVQYVTNDDEVWAFGKHCDTDLEDADLEDIELEGMTRWAQSPRRKKMITELNHKRIYDLCCSPTHSVALTEYGTVYTWGNDLCSLGRGTDRTMGASEEPGRVFKGLEEFRIKQIACGSTHTLVLSEDGLHIFAWGHNEHGQIGNGGKKNQSYPVKVWMSVSRRFVQIVCRDQSSFALDSDGVVYAWGRNTQGELGVGHRDDQLTPAKVKDFTELKITKLVCGFNHTLALSNEGVLYAWGQNFEGQIGVPKRKDQDVEKLPTAVAMKIGRIVDVAATPSSNISAALTEDSIVYMWGECRGQNIYEPTLTQYASLHEVFAYFSTPAVSYKQINHIPDPAFGLMRSCRQAFKEKQATGDLFIMINSPTGIEPIRIHSSILKMRCPHFRTLLNEVWKTRRVTNVLSVKTMSALVYKAFLQYLCTDDLLIDLEVEQLFDMITLAKEYKQNELIKICEQSIMTDVNDGNAFSFYAKARAIRNSVLQDFCLKYATNQIAPVMRHANFTNVDSAIVRDFVVEVVRRGAF